MQNSSFLIQNPHFPKFSTKVLLFFESCKYLHEILSRNLLAHSSLIPRSLYLSILSRYIPDTYPTHTRYIRISHEYPTNTPRMPHEYPKQGIFMTYARTREPYLYTRAYARALLISVSTLFVIIDNQLIIKKMMLYNIFLAQKFGRSKKKQYLCTRFAPEVSEPRKWRKSH